MASSSSSRAVVLVPRIIDTDVSIMLHIIGSNDRVLFAEASKKAVNTLLGMLNIPVGVFAGLHVQEEANLKAGEKNCGIWNLYHNMQKFDNYYNDPHPQKGFTEMRPVNDLDDFKALCLGANANLNFNPFFMLCSRYYYCGPVNGKGRKEKVEDKKKQPHCPSICSRCENKIKVYTRENHILMGDVAKEEGKYLIMDNLKILSPSEFDFNSLMLFPMAQRLSLEETQTLTTVIVPLGVEELLDILTRSVSRVDVLNSFYSEFLVKKMKMENERGDSSSSAE